VWRGSFIRHMTLCSFVSRHIAHLWLDTLLIRDWTHCSFVIGHFAHWRETLQNEHVTVALLIHMWQETLLIRDRTHCSFVTGHIAHSWQVTLLIHMWQETLLIDVIYIAARPQDASLILSFVTWQDTLLILIRDVTGHIAHSHSWRDRTHCSLSNHRTHSSFGNEHTDEWVMSHRWMSHVTHMNESCHTHERVMSGRIAHWAMCVWAMCV